MKKFAWLALALMMTACGDDAGATDGGPDGEDASMLDGSTTDAGDREDANTEADAGEDLDGGDRDAGDDAAPLDGGAMDAGDDAGMDAGDDAGPPVVCESGIACLRSQFCEIPCGSPTGTCQLRPASCDDTPTAEVCTCRNVTFRNACEANRARHAIAHEGACAGDGPACSLGGDSCEGGEYCYFRPRQACGAGGAGQCLQRPTSCPAPMGEQVCACDDSFYDSDCLAAMAGQSLQPTSACF